MIDPHLGGVSLGDHHHCACCIKSKCNSIKTKVKCNTWRDEWTVDTFLQKNAWEKKQLFIELKI